MEKPVVPAKPVMTITHIPLGMEVHVVEATNKAVDGENGNHFILLLPDNKNADDLDDIVKAILYLMAERAGKELSERYCRDRWRITRNGPATASAKYFHIHIYCFTETAKVRRAIDPLAVLQE